MGAKFGFCPTKTMGAIRGGDAEGANGGGPEGGGQSVVCPVRGPARGARCLAAHFNCGCVSLCISRSEPLPVGIRFFVALGLVSPNVGSWGDVRLIRGLGDILGDIRGPKGCADELGLGEVKCGVIESGRRQRGVGPAREVRAGVFQIFRLFNLHLCIA